MTAAILCLAAMLAGDPARYFEEKVAPILVRRCLACHNNEMKDGGISFLDRDSLLKGGSHGPAIVPGKPEKSYLPRALSHKEDVKMPPGIPLPRKEVKVLIEWIRRGAAWGRISAGVSTLSPWN